MEPSSTPLAGGRGVQQQLAIPVIDVVRCTGPLPIRIQALPWHVETILVPVVASLLELVHTFSLAKRCHGTVYPSVELLTCYLQVPPEGAI